ncbi:MAG: hypothetical protein H6739_10275 [Alphaproteobacteria bacterium]|nr:hypothetical protein [Alphaproteobacteria bacterium]
MKRFDRTEPPPGFTEEAEKGRRWLEQNPARATSPPPYWRRYRGALAEAFDHLCAYSIVCIPNGTVDHFVSIDEDPSRAYDWDNYRYADGWINASKQDLRSDRLLDPFDVQDGWFEMLLPSLQVVVTDRCPEALRDKADFTLRRLHLRDGEDVIRHREVWWNLYLDGEALPATLERMIPLLARAIRENPDAVARARAARQADQEPP